MAIATVFRHRAYTERGFAHFNERRYPQLSVFSTATPAPTTSAAQTLVINLPSSVKALSGIIVVLSLTVFAIAFWKLRAWRKRRQNASSDSTLENGGQPGTKELCTDSLEAAAANSERPMRSLLLPPIPPPASSGVGWKPQIRSKIVIPKPAKGRSRRAKKAWEKNLTKLIVPTVSSRPPSPPPPYIFSGPLGSVSSHRMSSLPAMPPTPPAALKSSFNNIKPPPARKPVPVASTTRISRNISKPAAAHRLSSPSSRKNDSKLPRPMTVSSAFECSMDDELYISAGETVRLLKEYEDEWCFVQRVGRIDAAKGFVPRCCLSERPKPVPQHIALPLVAACRR